MTDMRKHSYAGEYRSAIARAKKILIAAGFKWSTSTGRYSAFADTKKTTDGAHVSRIGASETIALHMRMRNFDRDTYLAETQRAIATLRAEGLPFDDRGWLACGRDAGKE